MFLWFPLTLPALLIIRLFRPWLLIRFSDLCAYSMGLMTGPLAIYLCKEKKQRSLDVFFAGRSCNQQFLKMATRLVPHLYRWPYSFFKSAEWLSRRMPGENEHRIYSKFENPERDIEGVLDKAPIHFKFNSDEERFGCQELIKLGIPAGSKFVCLIAREDAYFSYLKHGYDDFWNRCRNSNIDNYVLACEYLARKGYYVVRMGAKVSKPLPIKNSHIIDYGYGGDRTDFMDIYLASKCFFCISGMTGFDNLTSHVFRKPMVYVNVAHIGTIHTYLARALFITKKFVFRPENRVLTLREIFEEHSGLYLQYKPEYYLKNLEFFENSPEEIRDVVSEMVQRLEGSWVPNLEDEALQRRFWEIYPTQGISLDYGGPMHGKIRARVGAYYLHNNPDWLK